MKLKDILYFGNKCGGHLYFVSLILPGWVLQEEWRAGQYINIHGEMSNWLKVLAEKRHLGRPRHRCEVNNKIDPNGSDVWEKVLNLTEMR